MFQNFRLTHIPFIFSGVANLVGGISSLAAPRAMMIEFGFPPSIVDVPETWPVAAAFTGRAGALGLVQLVLYAQGHYEAADTMLLVMAGYLAITDPWVLWNTEGTSGPWILFRGVSTVLLALAGWAKWTSRR